MVENLRWSFKPCRIAFCSGVVVDSFQHDEHTAINTGFFEKNGDTAVYMGRQNQNHSYTCIHMLQRSHQTGFFSNLGRNGVSPRLYVNIRIFTV